MASSGVLLFSVWCEISQCSGSTSTIEKTKVSSSVKNKTLGKKKKKRIKLFIQQTSIGDRQNSRCRGYSSEEITEMLPW